MWAIARVVTILCGLGLMSILSYNYYAGLMAPVVYTEPRHTASVFILILFGGVMALVAVWDAVREQSAGRPV